MLMPGHWFGCCGSHSCWVLRIRFTHCAGRAHAAVDEPPLTLSLAQQISEPVQSERSSQYTRSALSEQKLPLATHRADVPSWMQQNSFCAAPVSYTHLTLPTNREV